MKLALFFTRGMDLGTWERVGMFEREVALYRKMQARGIKVVFVTYGGVGELEYEERIPGISILCNRWGLPRSVYEYMLPMLYARYFKNCDVIKTNQINGGLIALRAGKMTRKPTVVRGGYLWSELLAVKEGESAVCTRKIQELERVTFKKANRIIVTTVAMKQNIIDRVKDLTKPPVVIPNYVDTNLFMPNRGICKENRLVYIGRLEWQKNVAALLEAIEPLQINLDIIGDGAMYEELRSSFGTLNGRVSWRGSVPHTELPDYLNKAKAFVMPSHWEGHPKSLIEAMACGLAVIGANSPGIREVIRHGENGWLCGVDSTSIRKAIVDLIGPSELRERLGRRARKYVVDNYSLDRIASMEIALMEDVVEDYRIVAAA